MAYELWESGAGNLVGSFATERAALKVVRESVRAYGAEYARSWFLGYEDSDGETTLIAAGDELVQRAEGSAPRALHAKSSAI